MHVCDHTECRLPAEDWYKAGKAAARAGGEGGESDVGSGGE